MSKKTEETILKILKKNSTDAAAFEKVTLDSTLEDLGFDSLDIAEIFFDIEESFDITIPQNSGKQSIDLGVKTVQDLVAKVATLVASES